MSELPHAFYYLIKPKPALFEHLGQQAGHFPYLRPLLFPIRLKYYDIDSEYKTVSYMKAFMKLWLLIEIARDINTSQHEAQIALIFGNPADLKLATVDRWWEVEHIRWAGSEFSLFPQFFSPANCALLAKVGDPHWDKIIELVIRLGDL